MLIHLINSFILLLNLFAALIFLFGKLRMYKEKKADRTIVVKYEPPENLPPLVFSKLFSASLKDREIIAEVLDLSQKGYIRVTTENSKLYLNRVMGTKSLNDFELQFLDKLFADNPAVELRSLLYNGSILPRLNRVMVDFINAFIYKEFYTASSIKVTAFVAAVGFAFFFLAFGGFIYGPLLLLIPAGFLLVFSANDLLRKNERGKRLYENALGFKEYLKVVEMDRMKFENPTTEMDKKLHNYLPYAIALGLGNEWVQEFKRQSPELASSFKTKESNND